MPGRLKGALCGVGAGTARHSRGVPLCWGTALPGNTGGRIQGGRGDGHRATASTVPSKPRRLGHKPSLGTAQTGDGDVLGTHSGTRGAAHGGCPERQLGQSWGTRGSLGCWQGCCGDRAGDRPRRLAARWQPMAGNGSLTGTRGQAPLDHGHHRWATDSGQSGRVVATAAFPQVQCVGTQSHWGGHTGGTGGTGAALRDNPLLPHPPLMHRSSLSPASPVPVLTSPVSPWLSWAGVTSDRQGFCPQTPGLGHLRTPHVTLGVPSPPEE